MKIRKAFHVSGEGCMVSDSAPPTNRDPPVIHVSGRGVWFQLLAPQKHRSARSSTYRGGGVPSCSKASFFAYFDLYFEFLLKALVAKAKALVAKVLFQFNFAYL